MDSENVRRIRQYLDEVSEDESEGEGEVACSTEEEDHVSHSDHNTNTSYDDTDDDPDFRPSDISETEEESNSVDQTVEAVVRGAGEALELVFTPSGPNYLLGKDKKTRWRTLPNYSTNVRTRSVNLVRNLPGPIRDARNSKTPLECFKLMLDDQIINIIATNTNVYIDTISENFNRDRDCRHTDDVEIKSFFGLLILAGSLKGGKQNLEDLFGRDGFGMEAFYSTMSLKRFYFLQRTIRFDNTNNRAERRALDKFAPFREIFDLFVSNCNKNFSLGSFATIDEQLVPFRGRCHFRQYMKSKPAKYGIKVFTITDARVFYVKSMEVYVGKQPLDSPYTVSNAAQDVVLRLASGIEGSGRNITADNWFTSLPLVDELKKRNVTYVGTVRKNKRELPPQLVGKQREPFTSIFAFKEDVTAVSYAPKKNKSVVLVSSMHFDSAIDQETGDLKKPEIITFYNQTKSGVDVIDEKCGTYTTSRRCRRWPLVLFYRLLDIGCINAQVIFLSNNVDSKMNRRHFLREVGLSLIKPQTLKRSAIESLPKPLLSSVRKMARVEPKDIPLPEPPTGKGRCIICPRNKDIKVKSFCFKCRKLMCRAHMETLCENCRNPERPSDESD